jgi:filamentous hemagglutinin
MLISMTLIESFAGTHDMIGGKLSGLYDNQGNIKQGMSEAEINAYKVVSGVAIVPSIPFAAAQGLPPEVWNAVSVLLKAAK